MKPTSNEIIKQNIIDQLTWDSSVNANNVFVYVRDGKVELSGQVQNFTAKLAAERNAYQVSGVIDVDNRLEIVFPPGKTIPNDQEIEKKVKNILSWNNDIYEENIEVTSKNNIVSLQGKVATYFEKHHVPNLVISVDGVLEVNNQLEVSPIEDILDEHIFEELMRAFKRTYLIDEEKIKINVRNGEVTLKGRVDNFFVKLQAENLAIQTMGVRDVVNQLTIG